MSTPKTNGAGEAPSRIAEFPVLQSLMESNKRYVESEDKEVFEKGAKGQVRPAAAELGKHVLMRNSGPRRCGSDVPTRECPRA